MKVAEEWPGVENFEVSVCEQRGWEGCCLIVGPANCDA
jgi:hypothetical protein